MPNYYHLKNNVSNSKSTDNLDAYTFYLKGKQKYYNYNKEDNEEAIDLFKKALNIDSTYALAIAGLADAYGQRVTKYWDSDEWIDSALVLSKKAIKISPNLAEGYKALASAYQGKEEIELALVNYKKAIEINPNYWTALLNYGQIKLFSGQNDEALYWIRRASELAPDDIFGNISVSMAYKNLDCNNSAMKWALKALDLDQEHSYANIYLGDLYLNQGEIDKATLHFKRSVEIDSTAIFGWFLGARIEAVRGNNIKAKEYYDKYMEITQTDPEYFYAHTLLKLQENDSAKVILAEEVEDYTEYFSENSVSSIFNYFAFAEIYAINNDKLNAFKWWNKAIQMGYTDLNRVKIYPYFENMRQEPEYIRLLKLMGTKIDSMQSSTKKKYPEYFDCQ